MLPSGGYIRSVVTPTAVKCALMRNGGVSYDAPLLSEGTAYDGHFGCTCYHRVFCFNQFGDLAGTPPSKTVSAFPHATG